jgi:hypothetical protein
MVEQQHITQVILGYSTQSRWRRYLFSVIGGAAVGAGLLVGGPGGDIIKGLLAVGGGASALWQAS